MLNIKNKNYVFALLAAAFILSSGIATAYAAPTSPPTLKLVKSVTTDDGGSAIPDDWVLSALDGDSQVFFNKGGSGLFVEVPPDTELTLLESDGPAGYESSLIWSCNGRTMIEPNKITLSLGDKVTCEIASDDVVPTLTLVKRVINDNQGTSTADLWTLSASASGSKSSRNFIGTGNLTSDETASITSSVFVDVVYDLAESGGPLDYTALNDGRWDCEITFPNGFGYEVSGIVGISLSEGDTAVCTITNDDDAPSVQIIIPSKISGKINISAKVKGFDKVVPVFFKIHHTNGDLVYDAFAASDPYTISVPPKVFDAGSSYLVTSYADDKKGKSATSEITLNIPAKGKAG